MLQAEPDVYDWLCVCTSDVGGVSNVSAPGVGVT